MKSFVEKNRESSSSKRKPNTNATPLKFNKCLTNEESIDFDHVKLTILIG